MGSRRMLACSFATVVVAGCAALAGFEDEYTVGGAGTGSANTATGVGGSSTGTAATPTGTGGASTGATPTGSGGSSVGGSSVGGSSVGGSSVGGNPVGGSGQGGTEPLTWQVIDEFDVPIDGTLVPSNVILESGVSYRLRASGHFDCTGGGIECDAEYVGRSGGADDMAGSYDFGIGIDVSQFAPAVPPDWGDFNPAHNYQAPWVGDGTGITAKLFDPAYDNNTGNDLHIQILQLL